jgi:hypothetical protein
MTYNNFNKTEEELFDREFFKGVLVSTHEDWTYKALKNWIKSHDQRLLAEIESKLPEERKIFGEKYNSTQEDINYGFDECLEIVKKILK